MVTFILILLVFYFFRGVEGHFDHKFNRPWVSIDETVTKESARIVGMVL